MCTTLPCMQSHLVSLHSLNLLQVEQRVDTVGKNAVGSAQKTAIGHCFSEALGSCEGTWRGAIIGGST